MRPRRGPSSRRRRRRFCCERGRRGFLERSRTQACDDPLGRRGGVQPADAGGLEGDPADVSRPQRGLHKGLSTSIATGCSIAQATRFWPNSTALLKRCAAPPRFRQRRAPATISPPCAAGSVPHRRQSRRRHGTRWGPARRRGQCRRRALGGRGAGRTRAGTGNGGGGRDRKAGRGRAPNRCCGKTAGRPRVMVGRGSRAASGPGRAPATGEGLAADPACITTVAAAAAQYYSGRPLPRTDMLRARRK